MAYVYLGSKALSSPLGPATWNQALDNARDVLALERVQHAADGTHNALEIPRGIISYNWNGSSYVQHAIAGQVGTVGLTSVGTGEVRLEWTGGTTYFATPQSYEVVARDTAIETNPCLAHAYAVQTDQMEIKLARRTGTPNTWAATDMSFAVAIYSRPHSSTGTYPAVPTTNVGLDHPLGAEIWNTLIEPVRGLRTLFDARHSTTNGVHDDQTVSRCTFRLQWTGAYYTGIHLNGGTAPAIVRNGTGDVTLSFDGSATAKHVFVTPDYARSAGGLVTDIHTAAAPQPRDASGSIRVFLWKWSGSAWALADTDFTARVYW